MLCSLALVNVHIVGLRGITQMEHDLKERRRGRERERERERRKGRRSRG